MTESAEAPSKTLLDKQSSKARQRMSELGKAPTRWTDETRAEFDGLESRESPIPRTPAQGGAIRGRNRRSRSQGQRRETTGAGPDPEHARATRIEA